MPFSRHRSGSSTARFALMSPKGLRRQLIRKPWVLDAPLECSAVARFAAYPRLSPPTKSISQAREEPQAVSADSTPHICELVSVKVSYN